MRRALPIALFQMMLIGIVTVFCLQSVLQGNLLPRSHAQGRTNEPDSSHPYVYYTLKRPDGFVLARALKGADGQPLGAPEPVAHFDDGFGLAESDNVLSMQLSPDGRFLEIDGTRGHGEQVWIYDTRQGTLALVPPDVMGNFLHWLPGVTSHLFLYRPMFPLGPSAPMDGGGMRYRQQLVSQLVSNIGLIVALLCIVGMWMPAYAAPYLGTWRHPTPFMHRPYYGSQTISDRTVSFVDHDKPWYVNDGVFVRYDGMRWTHVRIGSCQGGVNCYDGHNGYDLNLWFEPVLSAAAGTVICAGWYNSLNHESALGLWAAVDHGNGYATAYGHLSALMVAVGDHVGTQWQLGTSGTSGSSTGPHLHMATYYLPNWSAMDPFGWAGDYPDPNVVPDHYLWVNDPGTSNTIPDLSKNGSAIYPGATLVDDGDAGWSRTGKWHKASSSSDINGHLHWTATSAGAATASATWQVSLPADGYYEVGVFVDDNHASSGWAPYTVYSVDPADQTTQVHHTVYVDQEHIGSFQGPYNWENTGSQWVSLGTYYFTSSMAAQVVLSNATGEKGLQLAADGVEFVPISM